MAAVFGCQARDEGRSPQRHETRCHSGPRQAAEEGVDEQRLAVVIDTEIVNIQVAGCIGHARHVERVVALIALASFEAIFETPQLVERAHPQRSAFRHQAHAAIEGAFEYRQPTVGIQAQQKKLARLIGGESEGDVLLRHPGRELARAGDLQFGLRCGRHAVGLPSRSLGCTITACACPAPSACVI